MMKNGEKMKQGGFVNLLHLYQVLTNGKPRDLRQLKNQMIIPDKSPTHGNS